MYRYEVLHGNHCMKDENGLAVLINRGNTFDSEQPNLHIQYPEKYRLRDSNSKAVPVKERQDFNIDLEIMSESELREYAREAGIDLGNTRKRESLIAKIQEAESASKDSDNEGEGSEEEGTES